MIRAQIADVRGYCVDVVGAHVVQPCVFHSFVCISGLESDTIDSPHHGTVMPAEYQYFKRGHRIDQEMALRITHTQCQLKEQIDVERGKYADLLADYRRALEVLPGYKGTNSWLL